MDLTNFAKPSVDVTPLEKVRGLIMTALGKTSVFDEPHSVVCAAIEAAMRQEGDTETQKYMHKMICDGVANLRECTRSYWELKAIEAPKIIENMAAACVYAFSSRVNSEAGRLMSLVVGAMDPLALVDIETNPQVYEKMTNDLNGFHDSLSNDIASVTNELRNAAGK